MNKSLKIKLTIALVAVFAIGVGLVVDGIVTNDVYATGGGHKVEICHFPLGNPNNPQTIEVNEHAVPTHLNHGDYLGPCDEPEPEPTGSITVCKIIANDEGVISDGSGVDGSFSIEWLDVEDHPTVPDSEDVLSTSQFDTPLSLNTDFIGDSENDAECVTYDDLELGSYYYDEEDVVGDDWNIPEYNDQVSVSVESLDDFFAYSGELFTPDAGDDSARDTNADGHIVLTEGRPDRTLVVLNTFIESDEQVYQCSDNIDNDEDGLIDSADPGCHEDGDPENSESYNPADDDETDEVLSACSIVVVSDTDDIVVETGEHAVETWDDHSAWTAFLPDALWIWATELVEDPVNEEITYTFEKEFVWYGDVSVDEATLGVASDNSYRVWLNGDLVGEDASENNFQLATQDEYNVTDDINYGTNVIRVEVTNWEGSSNPHANPAGALYRLDISGYNCEEPNLEPTGVITYPVSDGDVETGPITLMAEYTDPTPDGVDPVNWAVRTGTCAAGTNTVFGNVDGFNDPFTWDGELFTSDFDTSSFEPGEYCFVFNPTDDPGENDVRETREFTIEDQGESEPEPTHACSDDEDNDDDGLIDSADPGCHTDGDPENSESYDPTDDNETDETNGGGGGGSSRIRGSKSVSKDTNDEGEVLGEEVTCGVYLFEFIRLGEGNNPVEVMKLETFLNEFQGENLVVDGFYSQEDFEAVERFQVDNWENILAPWVPHGLSTAKTPTGYVYKTTMRWINVLKCPSLELELPILP